MNGVMRNTGRRGWTFAAIALALAALLAGCGGYSHDVRYRLTFAVEADGRIKTASSVINVLYYGGNSVGASGASGYSSVTGVAPVIDLGPDGWLVAAMSQNVSEWRRRKDQFGLSCKDPVGANQLLAAYGVNAGQLVGKSGDRRELVDGNHPAFIWFPKGEPYTMAQQLCPEEFPKLIASDVKFKSISIELVPDAPLKTQLEIKAPWLGDMRVDQRGGVSFGETFKPLLHLQIEVPGLKP